MPRVRVQAKHTTFREIVLQLDLRDVRGQALHVYVVVHLRLIPFSLLVFQVPLLLQLFELLELQFVSRHRHRGLHLLNLLFMVTGNFLQDSLCGLFGDAEVDWVSIPRDIVADLVNDLLFLLLDGGVKGAEGGDLLRGGLCVLG